MKKLILMAIMFIATTASFAQNAKRIYERYSDEAGVSAVYVSSSMFRLIGSLPEISVSGDDVDLAPIIKKLNGLYLIESENPDVNKKLVSDVEKLVKTDRFELLMETKEDGENMRIFVINRDEMVDGFVMLTSDSYGITYIFIDGEMPMEELEKLVKSDI